MRLLLDTHIWIWMSESPERIRQGVLDQLDDASTQRLFSAAVAYEISLKATLGKLDLPLDAPDWIVDRLRVFHGEPLAITLEHASATAKLPMHHRDPFDRLLIAQAQIEEVTLVTADAMLQKYSVPILFAS